LGYVYIVLSLVTHKDSGLRQCPQGNKGEFMRNLKSDDNAFTGLEAAIVLIAFVVVAAVFSYVVLGAGFFTTQKSQETVYKGVEQATSNIQMIGGVYGIQSGTGIGTLQLTLGLAPGAPSLDLTKLTIIVTQPDQNSVVQTLTFSTTATAGSNFGCAATSLSGQHQETVTIKLGTPLAANDKVTVELRPAVGAALPFSRTAPATIGNTQVLY
jgi:flagellin FlaB